MAYLVNNNNGIFYIVNRINGKIKYVKKLGRISKEEAKEQLAFWKQENEILEDWKQKVVPIPKGDFDIIYADPPWRYDFSKTKNRDIENKYPTMELSDICKLKIPSAENSVLYLWGTAPKLLEAVEVIKAWGFEYKTQMIWDKLRIGMGYYARGRHEILFIATKGTPGVPDKNNRPDSIITQARDKHSQKPHIVYEIIENGYPNKKYLELFARNTRKGWASWGNQV